MYVLQNRIGIKITTGFHDIRERYSPPGHQFNKYFRFFFFNNYFSSRFAYVSSRASTGVNKTRMK